MINVQFPLINVQSVFFILVFLLSALTESPAQTTIQYCDTAFYHSYRDETGQHCLFKRNILKDGFYRALKNKTIVEEFNVKDHQVDGLYKYFKQGTQVMVEGVYVRGFKSGVWKSFNPANSSLLASLLIYKEGKLQGKAVYYDTEKGAIQFKGIYKKNKKAGKWRVYEKGIYIGKLKFKDGQVLNSFKEKELWKNYKWRLESNTQ